MPTPCGSTSASRAAASLKLSIPSRPLRCPDGPRRRRSSCRRAPAAPACRPSPAGTALGRAPAGWRSAGVGRRRGPAYALRRAAPREGGRRHLSINRRVRLRGAPVPAHSAEASAATPTLRGSSLEMPVGGVSSASSAVRSGTSGAAIAATSSLVGLSRQARSNQRSNAVLPLPRGPISTTLYDGEPQPVRSERHRDSTACSCSRPASAGGKAPSPGVNSHSSPAFMSAV